MRHFLPTLLFLCFFFNTSRAQKEDKQFENNLTKMLSAKVNKDSPGLSILIAKKGAIVYERAFGSANIELNVPLRPEMVFNIGSITKQFTAVAILQLVEQAKISLEDSIQKFIKGFPSKGYHITIENLLTHTSGIKDYMQIDYQEPYMERRDFRPAVLIDSFKNFPLEFEPGTKFKYSNSGYFLLGYIIETVSGKTYPRYIQENILTPLSLTHTYYDNASTLILNRVSGYKRENQHFEKADFWSSTIAYAAGGMISNVEDLYKWHKGLYEYKILKKEMLTKAFTPFKLKDGSTTQYGYGWFVKTTNGIRSIEHDGSITGFLGREVYYPDEDIFVTVLFNCDCAPKDALSVTIASIVLGKPLQPEIKVDDVVLNKYAGTYVLVSDPKRSITIAKSRNQLIANVSAEEAYPLLFKSDTRFEFKGILGVECEFVNEKDKAIKFIVSQNGLYEWKKIQ